MHKQRKIILIAVTLLILSASIVIMRQISIKIEEHSVIEERKITLPLLPLFTDDSLIFNLGDVKKEQEIVIIYFNTECNYCKYEAQEVKRSIDRLRNVNIIWVSAEPLRKIKDFAIQNELDKVSGMTFAKINQIDCQNYLGSITIPSLFIYSKNKMLLKEFRGETSIENVLKIIQSQ